MLSPVEPPEIIKYTRVPRECVPITKSELERRGLTSLHTPSESTGNCHI